MTPPGTSPAGGGSWIAAPPRGSCPPWHFYWCDGHNDWHHHLDGAVAVIAEGMQNPEQ